MLIHLEKFKRIRKWNKLKNIVLVTFMELHPLVSLRMMKSSDLYYLHVAFTTTVSELTDQIE